MTNTTTIDTTGLAERVPFSEITRRVIEADPSLIEAMERASQDYHRFEDGWQAEAARHQRNADMPQESLRSRYGKALREAAAAVVARYEELLAAKQEEDRSS